MSKTNRQAARATLAIVEANFEPCTADLTPFWAVPVLCDCCGCVDMAWQGRTLPADGACLSQREHDEIRYDRSLRWELVDELEAEERYAYWRCYGRYQVEEERDSAEEQARQKAELVEGWLRAA